jgi:LSD1 subclass zinc finger protein
MEAGDFKLLCSGCGASLEYSAGARALKCVYCSAVTEIPRADDEEVDVAPNHVVTLTVSRTQLEDAVFQHLAEGNYTPDNLLEHATFTKIEQFFVPAYAFTGSYEAQWTASFGYDRTEHYTDFVRDSKGNSRPVSKTRTVTDWRPVNGSDTGDFSVLTYGGARLSDSPLDLTTRLVERCRMGGELVDYSTSFTSGFEVEAYGIRPNDAYAGRGEALVEKVIEAGVMRHAQGDRQKDWHWKSKKHKQSSRVLIPVCHVVYEFQGQAYNVWTDGTSTQNLVADKAPEDHSRKREVRIGFVPLAAAVVGAVIAVSGASEGIGNLPASALMWFGLAGSLLYGVLRRRGILSYSLKLRKAILAQRKLDTTNASNLEESERLKMVQACKRPDRSWIAGTAKDAVILPLASVIALSAAITPLLLEKLHDHGEREYVSTQVPVDNVAATQGEAPSQPAAAEIQNTPQEATPASDEPVAQQPVAASEPTQVTEASALAATDAQTQPAVQQAAANQEQVAAPAAQAAPAAVQVNLAQPVLAVLSAAAQNDWTSVDVNADKLGQVEVQSAVHRDRTAARAANIEGKAALQANNYAAAIDAFRRGVAADPADIELLNNLGYAFEEAGQQQDAIDTITNVLNRVPRRTAAWANLASSLAESGHLPEAKAALSVAVHYTGNRDRTLAFLQEQAATGRSDAIRQVSAAVSQQALNIPVARPTAVNMPVVQNTPAAHPTVPQQSSKGDEAYVRSMNQQLEQQLKDLGQSK